MEQQLGIVVLSLNYSINYETKSVLEQKELVAPRVLLDRYLHILVCVKLFNVSSVGRPGGPILPPDTSERLDSVARLSGLLQVLDTVSEDLKKSFSNEQNLELAEESRYQTIL